MKKTLLTIVMAACMACTVSVRAQDKGYRGFAEAGYGIGVDQYKTGFFTVETTHGYQFNHFIFAGAGIGLQYTGEYSYKGKTSSVDIEKRDAKVDVPIYANVHANFTKTKVSPMLDLKVGTYVNNGGGMYASLSAGARIATSERRAVNVSLSYSSQDMEFMQFYPLSLTTYTYKPFKGNVQALALKVGFEF